uniref:Dynein light chain LC8-type 2 n=1 Tax=Gallus gallus TaxID=9031 RepID=A0A8V1AGI0_CHICK
KATPGFKTRSHALLLQAGRRSEGERHPAAREDRSASEQTAPSTAYGIRRPSRAPRRLAGKSGAASPPAHSSRKDPGERAVTHPRRSLCTPIAGTGGRTCPAGLRPLRRRRLLCRCPGRCEGTPRGGDTHRNRNRPARRRRPPRPCGSGRDGRFTMSDRKAVIKNADMSEDMQQDAVDCATQAMEKYNIEKDIAAYIKKEFDKKYNPTWHCIVGRNFGSYVTHETKHFIYFYLGQVAILLFKSG